MILIVTIAVIMVLAVIISWYFLHTHSRKVSSRSYDILLKKILKHSIPEITVQQLSKAQQDFLLLDSREIHEYKISHIPNARLAGFTNTETLEGVVKDILKDTPIVVYCSVGYRSEKTAGRLLQMGYVNVYNLYGGLFEWSNCGHPLYDANDQPTKRVHAYSPAWGRWIKNAEQVY
jgi:rhodanese-related sulfurtransferase